MVMLAVLGSAVLGPAAADAADRYWDNNGSTLGFGTAGGTWGSSNNWNDLSDGGAGTFTTAITTSDIGNFGTGSDGLGTGTVAVTGTQVANGLAFGSASGNITLSGGTISLGGTTPTITVNNATNTISSILAGSAGIVKSGSGSLTLSPSGSNTFTGGLTIRSGTVTTGTLGLGANAVLLGDTSGSASATLLHIGGDATIPNALTVQSGSSGVNTVSQIVTGSSNYTGNWTLDGNLTFSRDATGTTLKTTGVVSGNGSVTLSGTSNGTIGFGGANTYTGGTTISPGVIVVPTSDSTGPAGNPTSGSFGAGTAPVVLNGGQLRSSTGGPRSVGNVVTIAANTTFATISGEQTLTFTGPATLNASRTLTVDVGSTVAGRSVTFAGAIGDGGSGFGLTKAGAGNGTLVLSGANTFSGSTAVTGGILSLGNSLALQNSALNTTTSVTGNTTAGLRTTVTTLTFGGLTGNKNLASVFSTSSGNYTSVTALTLNPGTGALHVYSGNITNGASGMNVVKSGAGTQTLNGTNTYNGTTTISGGTLALGSSGTIDNTSGVVLASGTFDVSAKGIGGYSVGNLSGNGDVIGALTVTNQLSIGSSPGTIDFESLSLGGSSTFLYEVTGGGSTADLSNVSAALDLGSATLSMVQLGTYTLGNKFTLFGYNSGNLSGTFNLLPNGTTFTAAGGDWQINYADSSAGLNGGTGNLFVTVTAVPEPTTLALLAASACLIGLGVTRRFQHLRTTAKP
jgi:autotransporter-associated beta strand protein